MKKNRGIAILCILLVGGQSILFAQGNFNHWPKGGSPQEIGKRVVELFLSSPHGAYGGGAKPHIPYFEVCTWYGALRFVDRAQDKDLQAKLIGRFSPLFAEDSALLPVPDHVDYSVFGALPFEIFLQAK